MISLHDLHLDDVNLKVYRTSLYCVMSHRLISISFGVRKQAGQNVWNNLRYRIRNVRSRYPEIDHESVFVEELGTDIQCFGFSNFIFVFKDWVNGYPEDDFWSN